jgi:hypothetical protein
MSLTISISQKSLPLSPGIPAAIVELGCPWIAVPGGFLYVLELGAVLKRCRNEGGAHRVRRVAAIEAEFAGVFAHHMVDRVRIHAPAFVLALAIVPARPEQRAVHVGTVAGELEDLMPEVVVLTIEAALRRNVWVHPRFPFAALDDDGRVWDQRIATDMVEVQVRGDDEINLGRVAAERRETGRNLLARMVIEAEEGAQPGTDPRGGIVLASDFLSLLSRLRGPHHP